jgi:hypothetical protein
MKQESIDAAAILASQFAESADAFSGAHEAEIRELALDLEDDVSQLVWLEMLELIRLDAIIDAGAELAKGDGA